MLPAALPVIHVPTAAQLSKQAVTFLVAKILESSVGLPFRRASSKTDFEDVRSDPNFRRRLELATAFVKDYDVWCDKHKEEPQTQAESTAMVLYESQQPIMEKRAPCHTLGVLYKDLSEVLEDLYRELELLKHDERTDANIEWFRYLRAIDLNARKMKIKELYQRLIQVIEDAKSWAVLASIWMK